MENVHAVFFLLQSVRRKAANGWSGRGSVPRRMGRGKVLSGSRGRGGHFPCNSAEQRLLTCSAAESAPAGVRAGVVCSFVARVRRGGAEESRHRRAERASPTPGSSSSREQHSQATGIQGGAGGAKGGNGWDLPVRRHRDHWDVWGGWRGCGLRSWRAGEVCQADDVARAVSRAGS